MNDKCSICDETATDTCDDCGKPVCTQHSHHWVIWDEDARMNVTFLLCDNCYYGDKKE